MKLLLILGSDETFAEVCVHVKPLGFDVIRYNNVHKAMDNIDEIDPTGIVISARDFPRHWKLLVQFTRSERPKDRCPIIILRGEQFSLEEMSKAFFLGVSGVVAESLGDPLEINRLQSILSRYIPVEEKRRFPRFFVESWHRFGFLLSNPQNNTIITGDIKSISITGLSFAPEHPAIMQDIFFDELLPGCSLRAGEMILSPVCKLVRLGRISSFRFVSFPGDEYNVLEKYLTDLPLLEYKIQLEQHKTAC